MPMPSPLGLAQTRFELMQFNNDALAVVAALSLMFAYSSVVLRVFGLRWMVLFLC